MQAGHGQQARPHKDCQPEVKTDKRTHRKLNMLVQLCFQLVVHPEPESLEPSTPSLSTRLLSSVQQHDPALLHAVCCKVTGLQQGTASSSTRQVPAILQHAQVVSNLSRPPLRAE